jgi:hypothetical protein
MRRIRRKVIATRKPALASGLKVLALSLPSSGGALSDRDAARFELLASALRPMGYSFSLRVLGSSDDGGLTEACASALSEEEPGLVFCSFYDRSAYEVIEASSLPFVGSCARALELLRSRSRVKRLWEARGVASPSCFRVRRTRTGAIAGRRLIASASDFPYIVKPDRADEEGASAASGARSIAFDSGALAASIDASLEELDEVLVEHFAGGSRSREYTVAMLGNGNAALVLPAEIGLSDARPIRAVTREDRLRGAAGAIAVVGEKGGRIADFARRALEIAPLRDYARVDIIEEEGELLALALDGQPTLPDPWLEACAAGAGLGPSEYLASVFEAARSRQAARRA